VCKYFIKKIDENIVRGGSIWEKFPPNRPSTRVKRLYEGKDPRAMFGLRGKFSYSFGKTQFTIYSKDPGAIRMQLGPEKRSWQITPHIKPLLAFPFARIKPRGKKTEGSTYEWFTGLKVIHKGWEKRMLLPPAYEVGFYTRSLIEEVIRIRVPA
jgi:hypothetical protein